jgi:pilus assembly protein CpaB
MGRRTMLLVAAFLVAALGTTLVFLYVNGANDRALANQRAKSILVAKSDIPAGTTGAAAQSGGQFVTRKVSAGSVAKGALSDSTSIADKVALAPIFAGEQILEDKFGASSQTSSLVLEPGKLAVSVQVADPNKLGSFLTPGSEVAVFVTQTDPGQPRTHVLLPSAKVIASGTQTLTSGDNSDAGALLTLSVDQAEAEKLILASKTGELYFAMIGSGAKINADEGTTLTEISR